jgi:hypothetical protein
MTAMTFVRPDWVRRLNAMAAGVGGAAAIVPLDADELIERALEVTGLDDFGDAGWEEAFNRLVTALDGEAQLNVVGRLMSRHDVLRHLCTRLWLEDERRRDPSIDEEVVRAPVIITGPARSGTSILHELMALDPHLRGPLAYEMAYPDTLLPDEHRAAWAEPEFDLWGDVHPEFRAIHELAATLPEECLWLLAPDFDLSFWSTCVDIPSFSAWRAQRDPVSTYQYHRSFLQQLQHGQPERTWVLKSPMHLSRLGAIFAVYPDARLVITHRDPARTVPSTVSAVCAGRWVRSDAVDPIKTAKTLAGGVGFIMNNAAAQCASLPSGQVADLHYLDLLHDPVAAITAAYEQLGLPIADGHGDRITAYLAARPQTKYGTHRYGPEDYGLDAENIRADLAPYVDAFGVKLEA